MIDVDVEQLREILWRGKLIGHFCLVGAEMNRIYGKWIPHNDKSTRNFTNRIKNGEDLIVEIKIDDQFAKSLVTMLDDNKFDWIMIEMRMI